MRVCNLKFAPVFPPTAESYGVPAQIGSGVAWGSLQGGFLKVLEGGADGGTTSLIRILPSQAPTHSLYVGGHWTGCSVCGSNAFLPERFFPPENFATDVFSGFILVATDLPTFRPELSCLAFFSHDPRAEEISRHRRLRVSSVLAALQAALHGVDQKVHGTVTIGGNHDKDNMPHYMGRVTHAHLGLERNIDQPPPFFFEANAACFSRDLYQWSGQSRPCSVSQTPFRVSRLRSLTVLAWILSVGTLKQMEDVGLANIQAMWSFQRVKLIWHVVLLPWSRLSVILWMDNPPAPVGMDETL